jgi:hypothetical protein
MKKALISGNRCWLRQDGARLETLRWHVWVYILVSTGFDGLQLALIVLASSVHGIM